MTKGPNRRTAIAAALFLIAAAAPAAADDKITIGFVTHAQGNPFIQQIVDGAQAAAKDFGVTLQVAQNAGGDPEGQLRAVQNFVNAGAQGVATSVPGESMAKGLNDIIASGIPIVQYNLLSASVNAPYVGEKSTQSGRILGKAIVDKLGGARQDGGSIRHGGRLRDWNVPTARWKRFFARLRPEAPVPAFAVDTLL